MPGFFLLSKWPIFLKTSRGVERGLKAYQPLDHLFRHEYSKIVAYLTAKYGSAKIDRIEDAVQDAMVKAMQVWGFQKVPDNPSAWLYRVAGNRLIDILRRENRQVPVDHLREDITVPEALLTKSVDETLPDEQLQMIFACCHPSLKDSEQIMLCLKLLCGLSVREIANALMKNEAAAKKAITRGKQKFKLLGKEILVPQGRELRKRLDRVLKVIYLLFNEGYKATEGSRLVKKDICEDAIRLAGILHQHRSFAIPELSALLALMCFNFARLNARVTPGNELLTLPEQDRALWDQRYIDWGNKFLNQASDKEHVSTYQIEAGIAWHYISAPTFAETDWQAILDLYDLLFKVNPSPMVALNRLVVLEKVVGAHQALDELENLSGVESLKKSHIFYTIKADFEAAVGHKTEARKSLKTALGLTRNMIEVDFLRKKLVNLS